MSCVPYCATAVGDLAEDSSERGLHPNHHTRLSTATACDYQNICDCSTVAHASASCTLVVSNMRSTPDTCMHVDGGLTTAHRSQARHCHSIHSITSLVMTKNKTS